MIQLSCIGRKTCSVYHVCSKYCDELATFGFVGIQYHGSKTVSVAGVRTKIDVMKPVRLVF